MDKAAPRSYDNMKAKNPSSLLWMIALIFLGMISLPLSLVYSNHSSRGEPQWAPVALHSILRADYSADPRATRIPAVKLNLIKDALDDQAREDSSQGFEDVQESLKTPVPTVGSGITLATATATATSMAQTATPTQSRPTPTRSHPTQAATPTPTPTNTFLLPTRTPLPTKAPTRTSKPPRKPEPTSTPRLTQKPTEPRPTQPPPTKPPTKSPPPDPYPPPPPPPKPTDPYP